MLWALALAVYGAREKPDRSKNNRKAILENKTFAHAFQRPKFCINAVLEISHFIFWVSS